MARTLPITWDIYTGQLTFDRDFCDYMKRFEIVTISLTILNNGASGTIPASSVGTLKPVNTYSTVLAQWTSFAQVGSTNVYTSTQTLNSTTIDTLLGTTNEKWNCVFDFSGTSVKSDTLAVVVENDVTRETDGSPTAVASPDDNWVAHGHAQTLTASQKLQASTNLGLNLTASKLLGEASSGGTGLPVPITLGTGLTMSGTTLNSAAGLSIGGTITGGVGGMLYDNAGVLAEDTSVTTDGAGTVSMANLVTSSNVTASGNVTAMGTVNITNASNTLTFANNSAVMSGGTLNIDAGGGTLSVASSGNVSVLFAGNLTVASASTVSGTNSGDQTITLTGNVTGSGTGSFATTIANGVVTNAMLAGSIDLTTKVTGILPVANGGTGVSTSGTTSQIAVGGGTGSAIVWTTASGTGAPLRQTAPAIVGGSAQALTTLGIRSTGTGAFDLTLANAENLTTGRTLTLAVGNAARTLTLSGNPTISGITTTGTGTLALSNKTLTISNTLTLAGTDSTTHTFPSTSATIARTDSAQTFSGTQTFSGSLSASGGIIVPSATANAIVLQDSGFQRTIVESASLAASKTTYWPANTGTLIGSGDSLTVTDGMIANTTVTEGKLSLSDLTTADVSTTKHGFAPKAPNDATKYLDGTGAYSVPSGGATVANNTGTIGLTRAQGSASTAMRSDGAPPLDQSIAPTWTGVHTFNNSISHTGTSSLTIPLGTVTLTGNLPDARNTVSNSTTTGLTAVTTLGAAGVVTNMPGTTAPTSFTTGTLTIGNGTAATNVGIGGGKVRAGTHFVSPRLYIVNSSTSSNSTVSLSCSADGILRLGNDAETTFTRLNFCGISATQANNPALSVTSASPSTFTVIAADGAAAANFSVTGATSLTGNVTQAGAQIFTPDAVAPALNAGAAVSVTATASTIAVNGVNALTLANGTNGQIKILDCTVVTAAGTATVTPTTTNGFSTVAFTAVGQTVTLLYTTTGGWAVLAVRNATVA